MLGFLNTLTHKTMLNYRYQLDLVAASVAAAVDDCFGIAAVAAVADIDFLHVLNSN